MSKSDLLPARYTYHIEWSEEDGIHIARCLEFPSLTAHGSTPDTALREIETVVAETVKWMQEENEPVPSPFRLRMSNCLASALP
ncbi:MAG: type II toxin-antitoxin system HicB family antitoxin [Planctomycetaceae bacterium]|jgi:predicted RNase H-like HicB family nuclease|nr:type II toxin-antitoxin system HicB family antitoxin [Planctomycetaceae bacterium]